MTFSGAKIALLHGVHIVTILRDDRPDIPFPNHWDLPGGGREGDETPEACALREVEEELCLRLSPGDIIWRREYTGSPPARVRSWFLVARMTDAQLARIRLGDEGQCWQSVELARFLAMETAVPHMQHRLADFLSDSAC
ncbi:MAG: NUDIX hydrolase [Paracoccaceae bacterium]